MLCLQVAQQELRITELDAKLAAANEQVRELGQQLLNGQKDQATSQQQLEATSNALSVVATALPEADPQPHIDSWTQLKGFTDRSLEYLPKPLALQFGLHESGADKVELLVVLAHHSGSTGADQGPGCLQLPYEATRRPDGRWSMKARSPQSVKISTWVKNCGLALTGRCKAQRAEPGQAVERLLVLEVRPLSEAAASAGQATPGGCEAQPTQLQAHASCSVGAGMTLAMWWWMCPQAVGSGAVLPSTLSAAGPAAHPASPISNMGSQGQQQPCAQQGAADGHVAAGATMTTTPHGEEGSLGPGFRTGMKRKAADADADADQSPEAGQAAAAASVKRHLGCGSQEPDLVAGVPQPGGAAGAAGLGNTEEEGSGLSQPAAGMECAPDEGDPEVSQPAAAPAHAVVATAWPDADPQPHIDSWTQLKGFTDRTLEYLPKPMALQFGLHECGADKVELLVVLAHHSGSTGADQGQLPYEATRRPDGRWSMKARSPQSVKISTWVKNCGLALTGRCKAQRAEPGQAVERLLVLEVQPRALGPCRQHLVLRRSHLTCKQSCLVRAVSH
ncbi:hypothetical protein HaLaN_08787 [Haematococcus lacustris]|uniref:Uncharacterized protein n=1 Tax=Haematococcus lacustris TaxID=44745 RepID=A0A699YTQ2_HAELA|nr:hypothetical protein HaLaN_08787 [Haematococcus lacustris]